MRNIIYRNFLKLKENTNNVITFYKGKSKICKSFADFHNDVDLAISRLNYLKQEYNCNRIGICGMISYDWITLDFACVIGGFQSVAIPESFSKEQVVKVLDEINVEVIICDYTLKDKLSDIHSNCYFFNSDPVSKEKFFNQLPLIKNSEEKNRIPENYSIGFSSGTSNKVKSINLVFREAKRENKLNFIKKIRLYVRYKRSFWSNKDNKIIIFMPFSHIQQRDFFRMALFNKFDIVLSDPANCLKHMILEKPNIMVSVPVFYEAIAYRIKEKLKSLKGFKLFAFNIFNWLGINKLRNKHPLKRMFSNYLFHDIRKLYGGRADYFVTGSAPVKQDVLRTFYSVGIRIYEGYGQSEVGNIAMNDERHFRIGSVGKPLQEVKISDESEILIKYDDERHKNQKDILTINDGYIHTGDLGYIDKGGYLYIKGRKDDVIIMQNGKKVYPSKIEDYLNNFEEIIDSLVYTMDNNKLYALLVCKKSIKSDHQPLNETIKSVNNIIASYEQIGFFQLIEEPFSIENGMLTSTFKKKRSAIVEKYKKGSFIQIN